MIPLVDVVGNGFTLAGKAAPLQILKAVPKANVGVVLGVTVILIDTCNAHCPFDGVKVYVPLAVLLTVAGFQVPLIPLSEVGGNVGAVVPAQNAGMGANTGKKIGLDNITPVNRLVVQPLIVNAKLEYKPAFNPVIIICPDAFAVKERGPTDTPSSV